MTSHHRPPISITLDKALTLLFLGLLLTLGIVLGSPVFEPFGQGRLTYITILGVPLIALAVLFKRSPQALRTMASEWWPMVGTLAVYESLKHMHANRITEWLGIPPQDELMLLIDEVLFGKTIALYLDHWTWPWFQTLMWFFYVWVYYAGPLVLLGYAYLRFSDLRLFMRLRLGLVLGLLGGYVLYLLVPVAGPRFLVGDQFKYPIPANPTLENLVFDTLRYNWDCFPSLHTAIPWVLTVLAWRQLPRLGRWICAFCSSGVTLSTIALRFHYGIDLIAAFVWVFIVWKAVNWLGRTSNYGVFELSLPSWLDPRSHPSRLPYARRFRQSVGVGSCFALVWIATERWFDPLLGSAAVGAVTTGAIAAVGLALGVRFGTRSKPAIGSTLWAATCWSLLLWAAYEPLLNTAASVGGYLGTSDQAILSGIYAVLLLIVVPLYYLLGCWLAGTQNQDRGERSLRQKPLAQCRQTGLILGIAGTACVAPLFLLPTLGPSQMLLGAGLLLAFLAWRTRKNPESNPTGSQPPSPMERSPLVNLAITAVMGFLMAQWIFLYPATLGRESKALSSVLAALGIAAVVALAIARWTGPRLGGAGLSGLALCLAFPALAITHASWPSLGSHLALLADNPWSYRVEERVRLLVTLGLLGFPAAGLFLGALVDRKGRSRWPVGSNLVPHLVLFATGSTASLWLAIPHLGLESSSLLVVLIVAITGVLSCWRGSWTTRLVGLSLIGVPLASGLLTPWPATSLHTNESRTLVATGSPPLVSQIVTPRQGVSSRVAILEGEQRAMATLSDGIVRSITSARRTTPRWMIQLGRLHSSHRSQGLLLGSTDTTALETLATNFQQVTMAGASVLVAEEFREGVPAPTLLSTATERAFLLANADRYDLIVSEIAPIAAIRERQLQTTDYFTLLRDRLNPDGALVYGIWLATASQDSVARIVTAAAAVFPHTSVWVIDDAAILLATNHPQRAGLGSYELQDIVDLEPSELTHLLSSRLLSPQDVAKVTADSKIGADTDRRRVLEHSYDAVVSPGNHLIPVVYSLGGYSAFEAVPLTDTAPAQLVDASMRADSGRRFHELVAPLLERTP